MYSEPVEGWARKTLENKMAFIDGRAISSFYRWLLRIISESTQILLCGCQSRRRCQHQRLATVGDEVEGLPEGGFDGTFVATAMQCTRATHAGLPRNEVVARDAVLVKLDALVAAFLAPEGDTNTTMTQLRANARAGNSYGKWTDENADEKWLYYKLIWMPGASRMQAMVRHLFAATASFVFINEAVVPPSQQKMKAEWMLGHFLTFAGHSSAGDSGGGGGSGDSGGTLSAKVDVKR